MRGVPSIGDHAAIGDGRSVALVSRAGSVDWLCWPRLESSAVFAYLLDTERGGLWSVAPAGDAKSTRRYVPDTNILETTFAAADGTLVLLDGMTVASEEDKRRTPLPEHELLRIVRCTSGRVEVVVRYAPRPDYGLARPHLTAGRLGIRCENGSELYTLRGDRPLELTDAVATARFELHAGETAAFALGYDAHEPTLLLPLGEHAIARMERSIEWWQRWIALSTYRGAYRDQVTRSLLAIKLMGFAPSGAIVAAPTTSLPERIGGDRNWDYRYCWLRDAAMTVHAAHATGYLDEAHAFCSWLLHTTRLTRPELRILYDVYGNLPADEEVLPLAGYCKSRPVRVRNAAARQLQLDCYGEVIDAVCRVDGGQLDHEVQKMLADFGRFVCAHWREPDHGIWERRDRPRHYTFSKAMCWVALDRLIHLVEIGGLHSPLGLLQMQRAAIRLDLELRGFDPAIASYTASYDEPEVDASLLLLPWYGFEDASSQRMQGTWRRIRAQLSAGPGLLYRSEHHRGREGAFAICSLWAADFLARGGGTLDEARQLFETALGYSNDLGLLAEEIDPATGGALGNFPQAYSHVGVIAAALAIEQRASRERKAAA